MAVITIVGDFGTGKTTLMKSMLEKTKQEKLVFALVRNDYQYPIYQDFKKYISMAVTKKDTAFVIDEARAVLPKKDPDPKKKHEGELLRFFINARKLNNFIFIVYHALNEVPIWLLNYSDKFIRFRTNDQIQYQVNRFRSFPTVTNSLLENPSMNNFEFDEVTVRP